MECFIHNCIDRVSNPKESSRYLTGGRKPIMWIPKVQYLPLLLTPAGLCTLINSRCSRSLRINQLAAPFYNHFQEPGFTPELSPAILFLSIAWISRQSRLVACASLASARDGFLGWSVHYAYNSACDITIIKE